MLTYRKNQTKSDPVREILARIEERQSKTGLSLFAKDRNTHGGKLPSVQGSVSGSSKTVSPTKVASMFPDMSAAREKAQARIHAESERTSFQSAGDTVGTSQQLPRKKPARRLNTTFPPALPLYNRGAAEDILSQSLAIGRDSYGSSGTQLSGLGINLNPFGYSRRTLAYSQTRTNYVVEWPETWPLKIMSLQEDRGKTTKTKLKPRHKQKKDYQDFSFERGSANLPQSLPSRRKARKVSETRAEINNPVQPQNELILSSRRESNYLNHSRKSSRKCADQLSSNNSSPPIPPYPSCEQIEGATSSRPVAMETSPLGTAKAILPPIINKGKTDNYTKVSQEHSPLDTCAQDQMDQLHQKEDSDYVNTESDAGDFATIIHEKDEGKTDQSLENSIELEEQLETRCIMSEEMCTTTPCQPTTPMYSDSDCTAPSTRDQTDDIAVIMRVASQVTEEQLVTDSASQNI